MLVDNREDILASQKQRIREIIEPFMTQMQLIFVDIEQARVSGNSILRIIVDRDGGLDMDTCEAFHRAIADPLDEIDYDYLEVSSPGDRPLKSESDFQRNLNKEVELTLYAAQNGIDDIAVIYSIPNFITDNNLFLLAQ